ncbi:hypothetical protein [Erwinia mallotivora]|uniref:hypothetical protein n=1 Tax=Erwinia mallotivora TaxID=69222 RepID=UPI00190F903C|nr:hypothetical protein [Erwinia mallotivora]
MRSAKDSSTASGSGEASNSFIAASCKFITVSSLFFDQRAMPPAIAGHYNALDTTEEDILQPKKSEL